MENFNLKDLKGKKVHFIGIGGISMSALAQMLKANQVMVQGSDEVENAEVFKLRKKGIKVWIRHDKSNLQGVDAVVFSSAISDDNEELVFARENGLLIVKRAELLGIVASGYKTVVSIAGSHGKTTATAMISEMFLRAKLNPTLHIGGILNSINSNYKIGGKKFFVTESCEYKDNYLFLKPDISVVLNVDADHLDYFGSIDGVKNSFLKFLSNTKNGGINVVCKDDENSSELAKNKDSVTFGFDKKADVYAVNIKEYKPCYFSFDVMFCKCKMGNIKLNIIGRHNIYNALASVVVGIACAIDFCDIKNTIENFSGVKRRCEKVFEKSDVVFYHDYAHHPEQIKNMIDMAKGLTRKNKGRVIVVFEPHTYSRTKFLFDEFVKELSQSDEIILLPVYSAREVPVMGYDSLKLASEIKKYNKNIFYLETYKEVRIKLKEILKPKDIVLILGAGTIERLVEYLNKNLILKN